MVLRGYLTSARIEHQSDTTGMKWRVPEINSSNVALWFPFGWARAACTPRTRVKNINRTKKHVICLDRDHIKKKSMQDSIESEAVRIQQEAILPLSCCLKSKLPEHSINHLRPHADTMQVQGLCQKSEHLVLVFDDPVLVVGINRAESYLLILAIDLIKESLVHERAVIGMIVLDKTLCLGQHLFKCIHDKNGFIHREIPHEVHIHIITDVITKGGTAPDLPACNETRHLRNEAGLCQDHLIHRDAITWFNMLRATNRS
jgi:hypothetical protein